MIEPIVKYNEDDFEENTYDFYTYLKYQGEFFSGTLLEEDGKSYTEFEGGNANGRMIFYHKNGTIFEDSILKNGKYVSGKKWYSDGQIEYDSEKNSYWDSDGLLAFADGSWLYKNGIKINGKDENGNYVRFAPNGKIAISHEPNIESRNTIYYDRILSKYYFEMLINLYPHLNSDFNGSIYGIFEWISQVYIQNRDRGEQLLIHLFNHPNDQVQSFAKHLHTLAIKKRNGSKEKTYWLENINNSIIVY